VSDLSPTDLPCGCRLQDLQRCDPDLQPDPDFLAEEAILWAIQRVNHAWVGARDPAPMDAHGEHDDAVPPPETQTFADRLCAPFPAPGERHPLALHAALLRAMAELAASVGAPLDNPLPAHRTLLTHLRVATVFARHDPNLRRQAIRAGTREVGHWLERLGKAPTSLDHGHLLLQSTLALFAFIERHLDTERSFLALTILQASDLLPPQDALPMAAWLLLLAPVQARSAPLHRARRAMAQDLSLSPAWQQRLQAATAKDDDAAVLLDCLRRPPPDATTALLLSDAIEHHLSRYRTGDLPCPDAWHETLRGLHEIPAPALRARLFESHPTCPHPGAPAVPPLSDDTRQEAQLQAARWALAVADWPGLSRHLRRLPSAPAARALALSLQAIACERQDDRQRALTLLGRIHEPDLPLEGRCCRGRLNAHRGHPQATADLEACFAADHGGPPEALALAQAAMHDQAWVAAEQWLNVAREQAPKWRPVQRFAHTLARLALAAASAHHAEGHDSQADGCLTLALRWGQASLRAEAQRLRAAVWARWQGDDDAKELLLNLPLADLEDLARHPEDAAAIPSAAPVWAERVVDGAPELLERHPHRAALFLLIAQAHLRLQQPDGAIAAAEAGLHHAGAPTPEAMAASEWAAPLFVCTARAEALRHDMGSAAFRLGAAILRCGLDETVLRAIGEILATGEAESIPTWWAGLNSALGPEGSRDVAQALRNLPPPASQPNTISALATALGARPMHVDPIERFLDQWWLHSAAPLDRWRALEQWLRQPPLAATDPTQTQLLHASQATAATVPPPAASTWELRRQDKASDAFAGDGKKN